MGALVGVDGLGRLALGRKNVAAAVGHDAGEGFGHAAIQRLQGFVVLLLLLQHGAQAQLGQGLVAFVALVGHPGQGCLGIIEPAFVHCGLGQQQAGLGCLRGAGVLVLEIGKGLAGARRILA
ncbi:hypothetical protein GY14_15765 [Delftia tsuruhatensis]|nr:hypothetical protein GY14_15765 [Delftia tsuruhatensis]